MVAHDPFLMILLQQLLPRAPYLIVYTVGIVLSLVFRQRAPRAATLCLIGCSLAVAMSLLSATAFALLIGEQNAGNLEPGRMSFLMSIASLASTFVGAIASALILSAVFVGRGPAAILQRTPPTTVPGELVGQLPPIAGDAFPEAVQRRGPAGL